MTEPHKRGAVLLVDDEMTLLKVGTRILERSGYSSVTAISGEQAVLRLTEGIPDLVCVLLDLQMPGMDGLDALAKVQEIAPGVPVVMMSGGMDERTADQCMAAGAQRVLRKPYGVAVLTSTMEELLGAAAD